MACARGHFAAAQLLLATAPGAAPVIEQHSGWLPLQEAATRGFTAVIELLLDAAPGTEGLHKTTVGRSALHYAVLNGHLSTARVLLERSAAAPAELIADLLMAASHFGCIAELDIQATVHTLLADLAASPEAAQLVAHLPDTARGRLRALALSLARLQRRLRLELSEAILQHILAAAPLEEQEKLPAQPCAAALPSPQLSRTLIQWHLHPRALASSDAEDEQDEPIAGASSDEEEHAEESEVQRREESEEESEEEHAEESEAEREEESDEERGWSEEREKESDEERGWSEEERRWSEEEWGSSADEWSSSGE
eukprot:scaffold8.g1714.t1